MGSHAANFIGNLPPGPFAYLPAIKRLGEKDAVCPLSLPVVESRERQILFPNDVHVATGIALSALTKSTTAGFVTHG
jgi:hypothetical protein